MGAPAALESDLRKLRDRKAAAEREAADLHEKATAKVGEIKASGVDVTTDAEAFAAIDEAFKAADTKRQEAAEAGSKIDRILQLAPDVTPARTPTGDRQRGGYSARAMAQRFMASEPYQRAKESLDSDAGMGNLGKIEVASREDTEVYLAAENDGRHGDLVPEDQRLANPLLLIRRKLRIFDLIANLTTDSDTVEYSIEVEPTGNDITGTAAVRDAAAETAYGTAAPRSTYQFDRATTTVQRIPHETVATKGNMADASQLEGILREALRSGLLRRAETQVVKGNGSGNNLRGITATSGIGSLSLNTGASERRVEAIHRGITNIRVNLEDEPTAIGISPSTWEEIVFEKDSNGQYLLVPDVRQMEQPTLWGLPVVVSSVFTDNEALIGRYAASEWYLRAGLSINAYDQHSDFASKGLVLLLAELRAAHVVRQPKAFCLVDTL